MNRKWMVAAGVAAILALVIGAAIGRSIMPSSSRPSSTELERFHDPVTDISLSYPATWTRLATPDPEVRLLVAADRSTSLLVRVTKSGLDTVTKQKLPIVRGFADDLLKEDGRARLARPPATIELGGLPGFRYRYSYKEAGGGRGAHSHYFLFKDGRIVQLVFQATPASRLASVQQTFERIAGTFRGRGH